MPLIYAVIVLLLNRGVCCNMSHATHTRSDTTISLITTAEMTRCRVNEVLIMNSLFPLIRGVFLLPPNNIWGSRCGVLLAAACRLSSAALQPVVLQGEHPSTANSAGMRGRLIARLSSVFFFLVIINI